MFILSRLVHGLFIIVCVWLLVVYFHKRAKFPKTKALKKSHKHHNPFHDIVSTASEHDHGHFCPCCGWKGKEFAPAGKRKTKNRQCPRCRARERHRKVCYTLSQGNYFNTSHPYPFRLVHFGAQPQMEKVINTFDDVDQVSVDYFYPGYNKYSKNVLKADVTDLRLPDNFAQGIIILHVLEHISELEKAFDELKRVLDNTGWIFVEVPCNSSPTKDCRGLQSDKERIKCGYQHDHVWKFNCDEIYQKIRARFNHLECSVIHIPEQWLDKQVFADKNIGARRRQLFCR